MLKWLTNYYIGEGIKNPGKIQSKIDAGKAMPGIYLLTLSETPGNLLEILSAPMLLQKSLRAFCQPIIGMAWGKDGAIGLAADILTEIYRKTGSFQVEEYMKNR